MQKACRLGSTFRFHGILLVLVVLVFVPLSSKGQSTDYIYGAPNSTDISSPFAVGIHNGARGLSGPFDLDKDGKIEVLLAQHTAGGRVHVVENVDVDTWEVVYSTPLIDSSGSSNNARFAAGGDLDADGNLELVYVAGNAYAGTDPAFSLGAYVWEHDGVVGSDDYGERPASVADFYEADGLDAPSFVRAEVMYIEDVDNDGQDELLIPANGPNSHDIFYIVSAIGQFQHEGAGTTFESWTIEGKAAPREGGAALGGGSPQALVVADLNGDGLKDISFQAFQDFNLFNGTVSGPDSLTLPSPGSGSAFYRADLAGNDDFAVFGGAAIDIDGDGNDEVFYTSWETNTLVVVDYGQGEDVLSIGPEDVLYNAINIEGIGGIAGANVDLDGDGNREVLVGGPQYIAEEFNAGKPSRFIAVAEFTGGSPTDSTSYQVDFLDTSSPADVHGFHTIVRDSAGTETIRYETAESQGGQIDTDDADGLFTSGIAYLGDADDDGRHEIALSFQGVDDSLLTIREFWAPDSLQGPFQIPAGETGPGPIGPGQSYEFSFFALPGANLSFATMFVESNDLFYAPLENGIPLYNADGSMREGDVTDQVFLWDAGTELNEEPGVGANQAPRQSEPGAGVPDTLNGVTVCCSHDPWEYPSVDSVISVTLGADESTGEFTVNIANVSDEGTLAKGQAKGIPLAPGVFSIHEVRGPFFEQRQPASAGLEALAEDGANSLMLSELQNRFGYFREVSDTTAAPLRAFLRIISVSGISIDVEDERLVLPSDFVLSPNYPNPFNPSTTFSFTLPIEKMVSIRIYDSAGREVRTLIDSRSYPAGTHLVTWDGKDAMGRAVASGTYHYSLEYGNFLQTKSMVLTK